MFPLTGSDHTLLHTSIGRKPIIWPLMVKYKWNQLKHFTYDHYIVSTFTNVPLVISSNHSTILASSISYCGDLELYDLSSLPKCDLKYENQNSSHSIFLMDRFFLIGENFTIVTSISLLPNLLSHDKGPQV